MEFQIDRSNEERSPVTSTINQSVSNIKSDLEHGALGFHAQNLRHWFNDTSLRCLMQFRPILPAIHISA